MENTFDHYIHNFFFLIYPHIALTIFWIGLIYKLIHNRPQIKTYSSTFFEKRNMLWAANFFHIGIISVFFGHLFGLLTPEWLYHLAIDSEIKRWLAISMGGTFGTIALIGLLGLIYRRLTQKRIQATSNFAELAILFLFLFEIVLGLSSIESTATESVRNYTDLGAWSQAIVSFRVDAFEIIQGHNLIYKIHIVTGLTIFLLVPFTKLMHIFVVPLSYIFRKGYQIVRAR